MIRISVITSHLQQDKTYAVCAIFDSMDFKESKLLDGRIRQLITELNSRGE